jgi:hypothetical protein
LVFLDFVLLFSKVFDVVVVCEGFGGDEVEFFLGVSLRVDVEFSSIGVHDSKNGVGGVAGDEDKHGPKICEGEENE